MSHRRYLRGLLSLFVLCIWIATASFAEHVFAQFPLCQPAHSPCCPLPANNSTESCPACHVTVTVAEKQASEQERPNPLPQSQNVAGYRPAPIIGSQRELTPGLRYRSAVFDLKDDLRI